MPLQPCIGNATWFPDTSCKTDQRFIPAGNMNVSGVISARRITSLKSHSLPHAVTAAARTV